MELSDKSETIKLVTIELLQDVRQEFMDKEIKPYILNNIQSLRVKGIALFDPIWIANAIFFINNSNVITSQLLTSKFSRHEIYSTDSYKELKEKFNNLAKVNVPPIQRYLCNVFNRFDDIDEGLCYIKFPISVKPNKIYQIDLGILDDINIKNKKDIEFISNLLTIRLLTK